MSNGAIELQLAGVRARISSTYSAFNEYARVHLEPLRVSAEGEVSVSATLRWHEGPMPDRLAAHPELADMERVDRDLYRGKDRLAWFRIDDLPDLQLGFQWDGARLRVAGDFFYRLSKTRTRDRIKRWVYRRRLPMLRQRRFTTLLYYLVYYPCFWWLERQQDFHPIHAAGVELEGGIVVFAGPSGVGKSTLSTGLAASPGGRLLSDTFLLQRGPTVCAVPEPLLLDEWSRGWIGAGAALLRPIDWRYCLGRAGFHWPRERLSAGGRVRMLLFPHRSVDQYVRPISAAQAQGQIGAGNLVVNDLRRYWAYAAALEMLDPSPLGEAREAGLRTLAGGVPSYEIGLTRMLTRDEVAAMIARLADATLRPNAGAERSYAIWGP